MNKIFITGSNGFLGKHLLFELKKRNKSFVAGDRSIYGDIHSQNNWNDLLKDSDCIIHLAARVHVMNDLSQNPLEEFRKINVYSTINIARSAKSAGVKRFIFLSSIKVNGEETFDKPFAAEDVPMPLDPYGVSKMEAELELLKLHETGIFEVIIIRPPLVYGPGVKGNFEKLFYFVSRDLPIPFGKVKNKRSFVSVLNLVDLIIAATTHPNAGGEIFTVSDNIDLSLPELINLIAKIQGKSAHLLPIPVGLIKLGATIIGKKKYVGRILGNLQVDIEKTKKILNWYPKYSFEKTYYSE